jgi:hypothetical protein
MIQFGRFVGSSRQKRSQAYGLIPRLPREADGQVTLSPGQELLSGL